MRENRTYSSEGGDGESRSRPLSREMRPVPARVIPAHAGIHSRGAPGACAELEDYPTVVPGFRRDDSRGGVDSRGRDGSRGRHGSRGGVDSRGRDGSRNRHQIGSVRCSSQASAGPLTSERSRARTVAW